MQFLQGFSSIRSKMLAFSLPILLIAALSLTTLNYLDTRAELTQLIEKQVEKGLRQLTEEMEHEFTAHRRIAEAVASFYSTQTTTLSKEDYRRLLETMLPLNQNTLGSGIWLEPYAYDEAAQYFGPYVYKDGSSLIYTEEYEDTSYDYPSTDWYLAGKAAQNGVAWTDPYYDEASGITMITAAVPLYHQGRFIGVVTADYDLTTIQSIISNVVFEEEGYTLLLDSSGQYIAHQDSEKVMRERIQDNPELQALGETVMAAVEGSDTVTMDGIEYAANHITLPSTGWKILTLLPTAVLYRSLQALVYKSAAITGAAVVVSALLIFLFSSRLLKGLQVFGDNFTHLVEGDFTRSAPVTSHDEVGQMSKAYNQVLEKLRGTISGIYDSEEKLAVTAEALAASTEETNQSISEVAGSVELVARNSSEQREQIERMNLATQSVYEQMKSIAQNVEAAKKSALDTSGLAEKGNQYVDDVIHQMQEINQQVAESASSVSNLNEKSKQIEEIISMITSIAEQTNLLALNAAIEAARAGEQGKGFAVVAEEIRKLAEASGHSSKNIRSLIGEIQLDIGHAAQVMETSTQATHSGMEQVRQTGQAFKGIGTSVERVTEEVGHIHASMLHILTQTKEMRDLGDSLFQIAISNDEATQNVSAATQQQTAMMEQIKNAAERLALLALTLQTEMRGFKI